MQCTHGKPATSIGHHFADRLHVSVSARTVIAEVRNAIKPEHRRAVEHRESRHAAYRGALIAHDDNRELYSRVVSGRI